VSIEDFDYAEPVLGFRLWALGDDGGLSGVAHDALWERGENVAECRATPSHASVPHKNCRCGFNALHALPPQAWRYGPGYVAGAIAAWGDIEWHRTGFRAERACAIALCFDAGDRGATRSLVERAAARYGVAAVPRADLLEHASRFARSLAPARLPIVRPSAPTAAVQRDPRSVARTGARGYWVGRHVVVEHSRPELSVGVTPELSRLMTRDSRLIAVAEGTELSRGDAVAVIHTDRGSYSVVAPHSGRVIGLNAEVLTDPRLAAADLSEGGWIARLGSRDLRGEDSPLIWGRRGREAHESFVARVGTAAAFDEIRLERHIACSRASCAEDALSLMRERLRRQAESAKARLEAAA